VIAPRVISEAAVPRPQVARLLNGPFPVFINTLDSVQSQFSWAESSVPVERDAFCPSETRIRCELEDLSGMNLVAKFSERSKRLIDENG
jgi:hypothetical protein